MTNQLNNETKDWLQVQVLKGKLDAAITASAQATQKRGEAAETAKQAKNAADNKAKSAYEAALAKNTATFNGAEVEAQIPATAATKAVDAASEVLNSAVAAIQANYGIEVKFGSPSGGGRTNL